MNQFLTARQLKMGKKGLFSISLLGIILTLFMLRPAEAQNNLLANPDFEGQFSTFTPNPAISDCPHGPCTTAQMAPGWLPWWVSQLEEHKDTDESWINRMPEFKRAEAPFMNRVHSGESAQQYFTFWSSHTAGIWQKVNVPNGVNLRFTIYGQAWSTHDDDPVSNTPTAVNMKIGIDPTGGTNWASPDVVWSAAQNPYDAYFPFSVDARSRSSVITVFTYSYQNEPRKHNDIYWDDASLTVIGGAPPPPTQQPQNNQQASADWEATRAVRAAAWQSSQRATATAQAVSNAQYTAQQTVEASIQQQQDGEAIAVVPEGDVPVVPVVAGPPPVPFYLSALPTPNADGVVLVAVPAGGSVWSVAANANITLAEIQSLNNLGPNDFVQAGDMLIVGYGDPNAGAEGEPVAEEPASTEIETETEIAEAAPVEEVAPPVLIPTPQPIPTPDVAPAIAVEETEKGGTAICLKAFDDANENGLHDPGEGLRAGVAFTLANGQRVVSNYVTTGVDEPYCIEGLEEGNYQISRSQATSEVLTTRGDWGVALSADSIVTLEFGSYNDTTPVAAVEPTAPDTTSSNLAAEAVVDTTTGSGGFSNVLTIGAVALALLLLVGVIVLVVTGSRRS